MKIKNIEIEPGESFNLIAGGIKLFIWYHGPEEDKTIGSDENGMVTVNNETSVESCISYYQPKKTE